MKVEGGHVEGRAGSQVGDRVARVGRLGQGQARPWSGVRGSGFFGAALARRPDKCNARRGYLERPLIELHDLSLASWASPYF
jgi:hypothetical protein